MSKRMKNPSGHLDLDSTILLTPTIRLTGKDVSRAFATRGIKDNVANRRKLKRLASRMMLNAGPDVIAPLLHDRLTLLMHGISFDKEVAGHDQTD